MITDIGSISDTHDSLASKATLITEILPVRRPIPFHEHLDEL
jgi:hypothetical protein